ncbi:MAG: efflux RND transporter periplasmic adaptor subunit [Verrucomicrobia bacterium]|nr:efflux RND transporter periplasmic adaptor subunit [Verrucomicrobiota bacterium]
MRPKKRKKAALAFLVICIALAAIFFFVWLFFLRYIEYTDDAYVEGNQVYITPLRPGFVTAIHSDDTYLVKKGQLLIDLDKTDAEIALSQSKENLARVVRDVCQMFHQVFAYRAEIEMRKAEYIKTAQDYEHRKDVISQGGVSLEDFEHSIAYLSASYYALQMTEILYEKALSLVQGTSIKSHPYVLEAADRVREAWVQLYRCQIYSPVEGLVAQRKIQVGMWVDSGKTLMSVIPLDQIWVNANYKETQLKKMRIGQKVRITSDLYGSDTVFHGTIAGLPGAAGNAFSLLPPQNLSGNWIKIVQRVPVRVSLDPQELERHPLRIGLSMEAIVDVRDVQGPLVPTTNEGSPTYETPIYEEEERGDEKAIVRIVEENLDPSLSDFADAPIIIEGKER